MYLSQDVQKRVFSIHKLDSTSKVSDDDINIFNSTVELITNPDRFKNNSAIKLLHTEGSDFSGREGALLRKLLYLLINIVNIEVPKGMKPSEAFRLAWVIFKEKSKGIGIISDALVKLVANIDVQNHLSKIYSSLVNIEGGDLNIPNSIIDDFGYIKANNAIPETPEAQRKRSGFEAHIPAQVQKEWRDYIENLYNKYKGPEENITEDINTKIRVKQGRHKTVSRRPQRSPIQHFHIFPYGYR